MKRTTVDREHVEEVFANIMLITKELATIARRTTTRKTSAAEATPS